MEGIVLRSLAPELLSVCLMAGTPLACQAVEPQPVVSIYDYQLPQFVFSDEQTDTTAPSTKPKSIELYQLLRSELNLSNTQLASFLGLKRRSLYNWLNDPNSSRKSESIELRLSNLKALYDDMDKEHHHLLYKVAFSPIDGNPMFGEALMKGANKDELLSWYDALYEQFDSLTM